MHTDYNWRKLAGRRKEQDPCRFAKYVRMQIGSGSAMEQSLGTALVGTPNLSLTKTFK